LAEDISEIAPLGNSVAAEAAKMKADWNDWNATLKDCFFPTLMEDKWWKK